MKIAVLFGGSSMERDVSIASASQVVAALRERGHQVLAVDANRGRLSPGEERELLAGQVPPLPPELADVSRPLAPVEQWEIGNADLIFLALHGGHGEDGTIQSVLDLAGIPYTGSGRLGSAVAWDKDVAKQLVQGAGVPTPVWAMAPADAREVSEEIGFPVIVKPNGQGSTVGLTRVDAADELQAAIDVAARFDREVMIEKFIAGRELTVGILGDEALAVGEIIPASGVGGIFDYESKYQPKGAEEIFPADIDTELAEAVQVYGLEVHKTLKLEDYSRADFRLDEDGGLWFLEANTLPGLSANSLLPQSAAAVGIDFGELCERICLAALRRGGAKET